MEKIAIVVVITVAVAAIVYLFGRARLTAQRLQRTAVAAVAAALAGGATVYGLERLTGNDVPGAETRLRQALTEELRNPTTQGPPRPLALMAELRSSHIVPALRATDAADAEAVLAARLALMRHLKSVDVATCRELALIGIQRGEKLDEMAQKLMREMLATMEKAYRAGRAALKAGKAPATPSDAEAAVLLGEAGLTPADFDKLRTLARLSPGDACDIGIRLNEAPARLPADKAGPLARYLAAAQ